MTKPTTARLIGKSVQRKEGRGKVTGSARYVDDITFPDMLHGTTVRSTAARGKILGIHFGDGIPWNEFTIVTAKDIPAKNCVALIIDDQPCLADGVVNHPEEAVVLLAHPDKYLLEEARRAVRIEIEPLPAIFTIEDSLAKKEIIWGEDNIFKSFLVEKGDVDAALATADIIVEGEYETGAQEQLYIEPQGMIARANAAEGVTVWGSLQCPYYVHKALKGIFGLPPESIRVVQTETGGGFGGKEEYPSMIAAHAALLALKSGKAGEDDLRPRGRHGGDHQAPSLAHAPSHRRHARRQARRDGYRFHDRWRRVRDALAGRPLARNDPRRRAIQLPQRAHSQPRRRHECAAARRLSRIRRAAKRLRARAPYGPRRRSRRHHARRIAPPQFHSPGRDARRRPGGPRKSRHGQADGSRLRAERLSRETRALPLRRIPAAARSSAASASLLSCTARDSRVRARNISRPRRPWKRRPKAACASSPAAPRWARARTRFSRRSPPKRSASTAEQIEIVQPDTAHVPNSGPTVASRTTMIVGKLVESAAQGDPAIADRQRAC